MNKLEALDIMIAAYEELDLSDTLGMPLSTAVTEDVWWHYCNGVMPSPQRRVRRALVQALRDAE